MPPATAHDTSVQDTGPLIEATAIVSGIDSLYLSGRSRLSEDLQREFTELKVKAQGRDHPVIFELAGEEVAMRAGGLGRYTFRLDHRYGYIGMTASRSLPTVRFQPLAEYLHGIGPAGMVEWFRSWMMAALGNVHLSASRVDVCADVTGWSPDASDRTRFACRASLRDTHEDGDAWTGFEFGRRKNGGVMARIYDKTRDVARTGNTWWYEIWGDRKPPGENVTRVEFEFGRNALRSFGIETPEDAFDSLGDLWRYGTHDWLTFRRPTEDATKSRWPIASEWLAVQEAGLTMPHLGIIRTYAAKDAATYRALLPGLTGYASSVAARKQAEDLDAAIAVIRTALADYEDESNVPFMDRVGYKSARTWLS